MSQVALLLVIPLATAVGTLLSSRARALQRWLSVAGAGALLGCALAVVADVWHHGPRAVAVGSWPSPFGIVLVADALSAAMVAVTGVIGLAVAIHSLASVDQRRAALGYHPLYHVQLLGVTGAFLTGDIFNLYVWFEVLLIASFALLVLGNQRAQLRGAVKYVLINLVASLLLLAAIALLHGATGTLEMAHLAERLRATGSPGLHAVLAMLFVAAFGLKAAVFPLFAWLPAAYHTPPVPVMALFAGLLTKVGVYALLRVLPLLFAQAAELTQHLLLFLAGATMLTGVLGAVAQEDVRRILSIHIVSQVGYLVLGLAMFTRLSLAGAVFYALHVMVVKANLFLIAGEMRRLGGSFALARCRGLARRSPLLAALFAISALSLAGFPPMSGFWAKLMLVSAGLREGRYAVIAVALLVGLLTTFSMLKIWLRAFWTPAGAQDQRTEQAGGARIGTSRGHRLAVLAPIFMLTALTLAAGLWPAPLMALADRAAAAVLEPDAYVKAVLGAAP